MDVFSISQLAKYSGLKPHTIRIWEKRYNALEPVRSEGNTRYYDGNQLKRLLNLVSLKSEEPNLSVLCGYSNDELFKKTENLLLKGLNRGDRTEFFINQFIASAISYDEQLFNKIFHNLLDEYKADEAYVKVIYPLMERIGLLWSADSLNTPSEHFISNLLKQKFYALIDNLPAPNKHSGKWLLFLREGEFHELGLLFTNFLIRQAGHVVIYLGANTPVTTIGQTIENTQPTQLFFFHMHHELLEDLKELIDTLRLVAPKTPIYIASSIEQKLLKGYKQVTVLNTADQLKAQLSFKG